MQKLGKMVLQLFDSTAIYQKREARKEQERRANLKIDFLVDEIVKTRNLLSKMLTETIDEFLKKIGPVTRENLGPLERVQNGNSRFTFNDKTKKYNRESPLDLEEQKKKQTGSNPKQAHWIWDSNPDEYGRYKNLNKKGLPSGLTISEVMAAGVAGGYDKDLGYRRRYGYKGDGFFWLPRADSYSNLDKKSNNRKNSKIKKGLLSHCAQHSGGLQQALAIYFDTGAPDGSIPLTNGKSMSEWEEYWSLQDQGIRDLQRMRDLEQSERKSAEENFEKFRHESYILENFDDFEQKFAEGGVGSWNVLPLVSRWHSWTSYLVYKGVLDLKAPECDGFGSTEEVKVSMLQKSSVGYSGDSQYGVYARYGAKTYGAKTARSGFWGTDIWGYASGALNSCISSFRKQIFGDSGSKSASFPESSTGKHNNLRDEHNDFAEKAKHNINLRDEHNCLTATMNFKPKERSTGKKLDHTEKKLHHAEKKLHQIEKKLHHIQKQTPIEKKLHHISSLVTFTHSEFIPVVSKLKNLIQQASLSETNIGLPGIDYGSGIPTQTMPELDIRHDPEVLLAAGLLEFIAMPIQAFILENFDEETKRRDEEDREMWKNPNHARGSGGSNGMGSGERGEEKKLKGWFAARREQAELELEKRSLEAVNHIMNPVSSSQTHADEVDLDNKSDHPAAGIHHNQNEDSRHQHERKKTIFFRGERLETETAQFELTRFGGSSLNDVKKNSNDTHTTSEEANSSPSSETNLRLPSDIECMDWLTFGSVANVSFMGLAGMARDGIGCVLKWIKEIDGVLREGGGGPKSGGRIKSVKDVIENSQKQTLSLNAALKATLKLLLNTPNVPIPGSSEFIHLSKFEYLDGSAVADLLPKLSRANARLQNIVRTAIDGKITGFVGALPERNSSANDSERPDPLHNYNDVLYNPLYNKVMIAEDSGKTDQKKSDQKNSTETTSRNTRNGKTEKVIHSLATDFTQIPRQRVDKIARLPLEERHYIDELQTSELAQQADSSSSSWFNSSGRSFHVSSDPALGMMKYMECGYGAENSFVENYRKRHLEVEELGDQEDKFRNQATLGNQDATLGNDDSEDLRKFETREENTNSGHSVGEYRNDERNNDEERHKEYRNDTEERHMDPRLDPIIEFHKGSYKFDVKKDWTDNPRNRREWVHIRGAVEVTGYLGKLFAAFSSVELEFSQDIERPSLATDHRSHETRQTRQESDFLGGAETSVDTRKGAAISTGIARSSGLSSIFEPNLQRWYAMDSVRHSAEKSNYYFEKIFNGVPFALNWDTNPNQLSKTGKGLCFSFYQDELVQVREQKKESPFQKQMLEKINEQIGRKKTADIGERTEVDTALLLRYEHVRQRKLKYGYDWRDYV